MLTAVVSRATPIPAAPVVAVSLVWARARSMVVATVVVVAADTIARGSDSA